MAAINAGLISGLLLIVTPTKPHNNAPARFNSVHPSSGIKVGLLAQMMKCQSGWIYCGADGGIRDDRQKHDMPDLAFVLHMAVLEAGNNIKDENPVTAEAAS
jgi:hypothetical protein